MNKRLIIPVLSISNHGGVRVLLNIANFLSENGVDVEIIYSRGELNSKFNISDRVKLTEVGPRISNKYLRWLMFIFAAPFLLKKADVILANFFVTFYAALLARLLNKKVMLSYLIQDVEYEFTSGLVRRVSKFLCELTYRHKDSKTYAANQYLFNELSHYNSGMKLFNVWIDKKFKDTPHFDEAKKYDIVYFLRDDPRKRIDRFDDLLSFFKHHSIKVLCITQSKVLFDKYECLVEKVVQPKDDSELISYIDQCKLYILTSSQEGFSLPPLECMARGVIPIVFRCGGPELYIKSGDNGVILDSQEEMQSVILELLNSIKKGDGIAEGLKKSAILTSQSISLDDEMMKLGKTLNLL